MKRNESASIEIQTRNEISEFFPADVIIENDNTLNIFKTGKGSLEGKEDVEVEKVFRCWK